MSSSVGVLPDFCFVTYRGDIVLLRDMVNELHQALMARGMDSDLWPLECILRSTRTFIEQMFEGVSKGTVELPKSDDLCHSIAKSLRSERLILRPEFIKAVLQEYVIQLSRLDISQIRYY